MRFILIYIFTCWSFSCFSQGNPVKIYLEQFGKKSKVVKHCFMNSLNYQDMHIILNDSLFDLIDFQNNDHTELDAMRNKNNWHRPESLFNLNNVTDYINEAQNISIIKGDKYPRDSLCSKIESFLVFNQFLLVQTKNQYFTSLSLWQIMESQTIIRLSYVSNSIIAKE